MADMQARILLVDDDVDYRESAATGLREAGYDVITAGNGPEGLAAAKRAHPDVVVTDVMMRTPEDGFVLARALRADPALRNTRLLMITGAGEEYGMAFEPDDLWLPVDRLLEKPVGLLQLLEEIAALLDTPETER